MFGFHSPSFERGLAYLQRGFDAFEKTKCIFSIVPVRISEKSRECFSLIERTAWRH